MQDVGTTPSTPIASAYLLLGKVFSYPTQEFYDFLGDGQAGHDLTTLRSALPFPLPVDSLVNPEVPLEQLEAAYVELFDVGFGPQVACSLYEGICSEDAPRRQTLDELLRFYDYFGASLSDKYRDYPDHLCAELEFMAYLNLKESRSAAERPADGLPFRLAQRDFLARHLARWMAPLRDRIFEHARIALYRAGMLCLGTLVERHQTLLESSVGAAGVQADTGGASEGRCP